MLAIPLEVSRCAKLLSPADDPMGTPSSRIWCPEAPSSTPLPPLSSSACRSSFHVVSNCAVVLAWPKDRKSTRLNSSHITISYAVFCLKKKKKKKKIKRYKKQYKTNMINKLTILRNSNLR